MKNLKLKDGRKERRETMNRREVEKAVKTRAERLHPSWVLFGGQLTFKSDYAGINVMIGYNFVREDEVIDTCDWTKFAKFVEAALREAGVTGFKEVTQSVNMPARKATARIWRTKQL